jgi:glutathione S-transferase
MPVDYSLHYWPIPFRGHFVRFVLAHVGATWDEPDAGEVATLKANHQTPRGYPFMAPPLLIDHACARELSQLPAILLYLGERHGLMRDAATSMRVVCDAMDVLYEITRHHGEQMWDDASWQAFVSQRLPQWMAIHEQLLQGLATPFVEGERVGLADLCLAALWHTMIDQLPGLRALLLRHAPIVYDLVHRVVAAPALAALLATWADADPGYCGGQIEASLLAVTSAQA